MRPSLIIGNWKLNGSKQLVNTLVSDLQHALPSGGNYQVAIAPPVIYLDQAAALLNGDHRITLAAQNVDPHLTGAFTGEISVNMLKEFAVTTVLIGHSERRHYHQEQDRLVAQKFSCLLTAGLVPVLCIGETASQRAAGETERVCTSQLDAIITLLGASAFRNSAIAYEPIWAIGSGQSASPQEAQAVHHCIRRYLAQHDETAAASTRLLYGGSVSEHNAQQLCQMPDIDGVLVGGASLNPASFAATIAAVAATTP